MYEKEPQSARKHDCSQSDRWRKVRSGHDRAKMERSDRSPLSLSVSAPHIPPPHPVFFFSSLGNFSFLHRSSRLPKWLPSFLRRQGSPRQIWEDGRGRGGNWQTKVYGERGEKAKVNKCRWSRCSYSTLVAKATIHVTSRVRWGIQFKAAIMLWWKHHVWWVSPPVFSSPSLPEPKAAPFETNSLSSFDISGPSVSLSFSHAHTLSLPCAPSGYNTQSHRVYITFTQPAGGRDEENDTQEWVSLVWWIFIEQKKKKADCWDRFTLFLQEISHPGLRERTHHKTVTKISNISCHIC